MRQPVGPLFLVLFLGALPLAPAWAATLQEQVAAMPLPAAGVHPRVLFTKEELPRIRLRAATPHGKIAVEEIRWQADSPGKAVLDKARAGEQVKNEDLIHFAFLQTLLYLTTEDPARLRNAQDLLAAWAKAYAHVSPYDRHGYEFALTYDLLYDDLSEDVRAAMRGNMAGGMTEQNRDAWLHSGAYMGPVLAGRPCDWGAIYSGCLAMQWLAIAGEDPRASREFLASIVDFMQYIADYGLSAEGQLMAGSGYATGDFINYGYGVRALQQHGVMLVDHPNLREMGTWLAYETLPGLYMTDNRNFSGGFHPGLSPLILSLATRDHPAARWLVDRALGPDRDLSCGLAGLLWGEFSPTPVPPPDLPLCRWSSSFGTVLSRSGWDRGSFFATNMEPLGGGKVHADLGSFTFYSHGLAFAADPGVGFPNADDHNNVFIDGQSQYSSGGSNLSDAILRTHLHSTLADFTLMDLKPAYEQYVAYTTSRGKADWTQLEYGKGLPFVWHKRMSLQRADRYALYVRGSVQPYAVILDDVHQDDKPRTYAWLMHTRARPETTGPGQATLFSRYAGDYLQSEASRTPAIFTGEVPTAGTYTVWILMRKWPTQKYWTSHNASSLVNGRGAGYTYLNDYLADWAWYPFPKQELTTGRNTVSVHLSRRGGLIAQVLVSSDPKFTPRTMAVPEPRPGAEVLPPTAILFQRQTDGSGPDWSLHTDPGPRMEVIFLQPGAEQLKLDSVQAPRAVPVALRAQQQATHAGFAALLLPHDANDPTPQLTRQGDTGEAVLRWGPYTDYLYANPASERLFRGKDLATDGKFALVRVHNDAITGYLLSGGTNLAFRGQTLVGSSAGPVSVMNDGASCQVQAPGGATVRALRLGATQVRCNYRDRPAEALGGLLRIVVPRLASEWQVTVSPDGSLVTVEGDGPRPLKIQAPRAIKCVVNGVSVWFSRDGFGNIYPKLDLTVLTHGPEPRNSKPEDALLVTPPPPAPLASVPLPTDGWRFQPDPGAVGEKDRWFAVDFADQNWAPIGIGDFWDQFGHKCLGFGWYRRTVPLPACPAPGGKTVLAFEAVDEMAWVWVNGEFAGEYSEFGPAGWTDPFTIDVTKHLRWAAPNQFTIRIKNTAAAGGIYKPVALQVLPTP